jgi:hypothetical protein
VKHDINNNDNIEEFENLKQFIVEWDLIKWINFYIKSIDFLLIKK